MTDTPMEHADKFCWTGPGQVRVIDFDPSEVTEAYSRELEQTVNDSDILPGEKLIALGYIRDKEVPGRVSDLLAEYEIPLPSWRA